jgi:hypothetical protein
MIVDQCIESSHSCGSCRIVELTLYILTCNVSCSHDYEGSRHFSSKWMDFQPIMILRKQIHSR